MENFLSQYQGQNPRELSPLVLAYIGDAVFEMLVRQEVLSQGNAPVAKLHRRARERVNAKAQRDFYERISAELTPEESAVFKRGRNAKSFTAPKNADLLDYRHATGLEAVFGFLYLDGKIDRVLALYAMGKDKQNGEEK